MKTSSRVQLHVGRPGSMLQMTKRYQKYGATVAFEFLLYNSPIKLNIWWSCLNGWFKFGCIHWHMQKDHVMAPCFHSLYQGSSCLHSQILSEQEDAMPQCHRTNIGPWKELHYKIGDHDFHCFLFKAENAWGLIEPSNVFSSGLGWSLGKGRGLHQGSHGNFLSSGFLARQEVSWCGRRNGWCHEV